MHFILWKSPKKSPKPNVKKPSPARGPKKSGPARPKPDNCRPGTSLPCDNPIFEQCLLHDSAIVNLSSEAFYCCKWGLFLQYEYIYRYILSLPTKLLGKAWVTFDSKPKPKINKQLKIQDSTTITENFKKYKIICTEKCEWYFFHS